MDIQTRARLTWKVFDMVSKKPISCHTKYRYALKKKRQRLLEKAGQREWSDIRIVYMPEKIPVFTQNKGQIFWEQVTQHKNLMYA